MCVRGLVFLCLFALKANGIPGESYAPCPDGLKRCSDQTHCCPEARICCLADRFCCGRNLDSVINATLARSTFPAEPHIEPEVPANQVSDWKYESANNFIVPGDSHFPAVAHEDNVRVNEDAPNSDFGQDLGAASPTNVDYFIPKLPFIDTSGRFIQQPRFWEMLSESGQLGKEPHVSYGPSEKDVRESRNLNDDYPKAHYPSYYDGAKSSDDAEQRLNQYGPVLTIFRSGANSEFRRPPSASQDTFELPYRPYRHLKTSNRNDFTNDAYHIPAETSKQSSHSSNPVMYGNDFQYESSDSRDAEMPPGLLQRIRSNSYSEMDDLLNTKLGENPVIIIDNS